MKPIDIILIVLLSILLLCIIAYLIWQKRQGKSGCGCGCNGCPSAGACQRLAQKEKTPDIQSGEEDEDA